MSQKIRQIQSRRGNTVKKNRKLVRVTLGLSVEQTEEDFKGKSGDDPTKSFLRVATRQRAEMLASRTAQRVANSVMSSNKNTSFNRLLEMIRQAITKEVLNRKTTFSGFNPKKSTIERRKRKYPFKVVNDGDPYVAGTRSVNNLFYNRIAIKRVRKR